MGVCAGSGSLYQGPGRHVANEENVLLLLVSILSKSLYWILSFGIHRCMYDSLPSLNDVFADYFKKISSLHIDIKVNRLTVF